MANATDIRKTLTDTTPFYAFVGAGDLAVEKIREVPERISGLNIDVPKFELPRFEAPKFEMPKIPTDPQVIRTRVADTAAEVQEKVTARLATLTAAGKEAPGKAQDFAKAQYGKAGDYATQLREIYGDLADRGHKVVDKLGKKEEQAEPAAAPAPKAAAEPAAESAEAKPAAAKPKPAAKRAPKKATPPAE